MRAYRFFDGLRGEPKPWLLALVRNSCMTWLQANRPAELVGLRRRRGRRRDRRKRTTPETLALRAIDRRMLNEALAALPAHFREALILREMEDLSYKDIARITDVPDRHGDVAPGASAPAARRIAARHIEGRREPGVQMSPEEAGKLLHAYLDGELDPAASLELEAYLAKNPAARAACERLRTISAAIRDHADYHAAPAALAARLRASVPVAPEPLVRRAAGLPWFKLAGSFAAVALVTWAIALGSLRPDADERIVQDVLASHVRATLASRPTDVVSSDQHTVKPWMSAHLNFSPPVTDLSAQGFELAGRAAGLHRRAAGRDARSTAAASTSSTPSSGPRSGAARRSGRSRATAST